MVVHTWKIEVIIEEHLGIHDQVKYDAESLAADIKDSWFPPRINLKLKGLKVGLVEVKES